MLLSKPPIRFPSRLASSCNSCKKLIGKRKGLLFIGLDLFKHELSSTQMSINRSFLQISSAFPRTPTNSALPFSQYFRSQNRDWTCPRCRVDIAKQRRKKSNGAVREGQSYGDRDGNGNGLPETLDQRTSALLKQCRPPPYRFGRFEDEASVEYSELGPVWENEMKPRPQNSSPVRLRYFDKREEVTRALVARSPDRLLQALDEVIEDRMYMGSISDTQYTAILELLDPEFLVKDFQLVHYNLYKPYKMWIHEMDLKHTLDEYSKKMEKLMTARMDLGKALGVADFKVLLKIARATGKRDMAGAVWDNMHTQGIGPDIDCFKNYMGAIVWNGYYADDGAEGRLRHTRSYLDAHKHGRTTLFNNGRNFSLGGSGIKNEIERLAEQMAGRGIKGDQDTYIFQMIAAAREGQLGAVKSTLYTKWGIDADNVSENDGQAPSNETDLGTPPLAISPHLMHAIVHCFCCNNDLATALRLVGFISRTSGITIPSATWSLIFEWSFILSKKRYGRVAKETGQYPPPYPESSLLTVWQTMLSFPYKILPNPPMFNRLIARLYESGLKDSFLTALSLSLGCQDGSRAASDAALKKVQKAVDRGWPEEFIRPLRQKLRVLEVLRKRNHKYIRRWIEQALALSLSPMNYAPFWESRGLLSLLKKCENYLPEVVSFHTVTGHVTFRSRTAEAVVVSKQQQASVASKRLQASFYKPPFAASKHWESVTRSAEANYRTEGDSVLHLQREFRLEDKMRGAATRAEHALRKRREKEVARGYKAYDFDDEVTDKGSQQQSTSSSLSASESGVRRSQGLQALVRQSRRKAAQPRGNEAEGMEGIDSTSYEPRYGMA